MADWIVQPPGWFRSLLGRGTWRGRPSRQTAYRTFDDGPVPEQTPWVLDVLRRHGIRATFFCVGDNVRKHPDVFRQLTEAGHEVGNHTFNHLQYFRTAASRYLDNADRCSRIAGSPRLFRPPHGQMTPQAVARLLRTFDKVVFWDVMPRDYDCRLTPQQVFDNVRRHVRNGSIIVFHDSVKAGDRMRHALEASIEWLERNGYSFDTVGNI